MVQVRCLYEHKNDECRMKVFYIQVKIASVHPPSLVPSFLLTHRLSAEDIAWCGWDYKAETLMIQSLTGRLHPKHSEIHFLVNIQRYHSVLETAMSDPTRIRHAAARSWNTPTLSDTRHFPWPSSRQIVKVQHPWGSQYIVPIVWVWCCACECSKRAFCEN